jgi:hypothetical protein
VVWPIVVNLKQFGKKWPLPSRGNIKILAWRDCRNQANIWATRVSVLRTQPLRYSSNLFVGKCVRGREFVPSSVNIRSHLMRDKNVSTKLAFTLGDRNGRSAWLWRIIPTFDSERNLPVRLVTCTQQPRSVIAYTCFSTLFLRC